MLDKIKGRLPAGGLQLDPRVTLAGMAVLAAAAAVAVVFYLWRDNASYRPLYGAGEAFPAAEVMQVLDGEALAYRVHPQSGQVLVREDQLALGVPGSLSNKPVPPAAEGEQAQQPSTENKGMTSLREESTRQLDYDQSVVHVKHAGFALRQQSVAVVLNAEAAPEGGWSDAARAELEAMVKSAVGFNAGRGDLLTLSVLPFAAVSDAGQALAWWENPQVHALAKIAVAGLVALLLLLLVVRPAIRSLTRREGEPAPNAAAEATLAAPTAMPALAGDARPALAGPRLEGGTATIFGELNPLSEIRLPAPGSGLEMQIEHLQMLAKNDPERVSEVIKHWIGRNERDLNPAG
ncbi:flagellar M-ring protein FliF C-terminal domain-containing protein [Pseudomonadota bacterium DY0742]